ncbi:hypothetical protein, partial [Acinetobacter baumannii]|uniref:hypothetical protein n=1 Tax=Acinetobacter baumannii TaxID=470 RepID=UPI000D50AA63
VINSLNADRINAERAAVETVVTVVIGEDYFAAHCVNANGTTKLLEELDAETLAVTYYGTNLGELTKDTAALTFLQLYCG